MSRKRVGDDSSGTLPRGLRFKGFGCGSGDRTRGRQHLPAFPRCAYRRGDAGRPCPALRRCLKMPSVDKEAGLATNLTAAVQELTEAVNTFDATISNPEASASEMGAGFGEVLGAFATTFS